MENLSFLGVPILKHITVFWQVIENIQPTLICLCIGTYKAINFPFGPNGKLMILGVPILKYIRDHNTYANKPTFWGFSEHTYLHVYKQNFNGRIIGKKLLTVSEVVQVGSEM